MDTVSELCNTHCDRLAAGLFVLLTLLLPAVEAPGSSSERPGWGAVPYADATGTGVTFRTWAPHASSVSVRGEFNAWSGSASPMQPEGSGLWSLDVPEARPGQHYKFHINGELWRRDPYSRQIQSTGNRNSVIYDPSAFDWTSAPPPFPDHAGLVIYELHVGTFHDPLPENGLPGQFTDAVAKLEHLEKLGINAVQLMPVSDFATTRSWGYNPSYPFAIEPSYGTPDELKEFIQACHERGITVLMDMVHNHYGEDGNDWSLWRYDGWWQGPYGGIFFYQEPGRCCTRWGPRPDYSRPEVLEYITENFLMWLRDFRVGGFRWDAPKHMLYEDGSSGAPIPDGPTVISQVLAAVEAEFPGTYHIAEDVPDLEGFHAHWDMSFQSRLQSVMSTHSDSERDITLLLDRIARPPGRIVYSESHDTTGTLNSGQRLPARISPGSPEDYWARKRTSLAAAITLTSPGTPMIFQGQEMLEVRPFSCSTPLDWSRTNQFPHMMHLYRDLIHTRRNKQGVSGGLLGSECDFLLVDNERNVLAYHRHDPALPGEDVVVVINASAAIRKDFPIPFPEPGTWFVHLNTDSTRYGPDYHDVGHPVAEADPTTAVALLDLGAYSALLLSRTPRQDIELLSTEWIDAPRGNHNGILDPGETIKGRVILRNTSRQDIAPVTVQLVTASEHITVTRPLVMLDSIPGQATVTNREPLAFTIATNTPCGTEFPLHLLVEYEQSTSLHPLLMKTGNDLGECSPFDALADADGDGLPDWWELHYFGGPTNAQAHADSDGNGMTNLEEYLAGTDPTDPRSALRLSVDPPRSGESGPLRIQWPSAPGRSYRLLHTHSLASGVFDVAVSNIAATPPHNSYALPHDHAHPAFYRLLLEDSLPAEK